MTEYHDDEFQEHLSSPQAAVAFAKQLRTNADWSKRRFHEFLLEVEARPVLWNGYAPTFDGFMRKCHLGSPTVHEQWKIGRGVVGDKQDVIGVHGTRHVILAPKDQRVAFVREMVKTAKREKVPLSEQRVRQMAYDFGRQRPPDDEVDGDQPSYAQLTKENARLKRENERQRETIAAQKATISALKKQIASAKGKRGGEARPS